MVESGALTFTEILFVLALTVYNLSTLLKKVIKSLKKTEKNKPNKRVITTFIGFKNYFVFLLTITLIKMSLFGVHAKSAISNCFSKIFYERPYHKIIKVTARFFYL